jgi:nitrogen fixation NifU-like protein
MTTPYGDVIQDHFRRPRHYGSLAVPDIRHEDVNPFCGDRVRIELSLSNDTVTDARFQGDLCMIARAASSVLMEMIAGLTLDSIRELEEQKLFDALHAEIHASRRQCVLLPLSVLQTGVRKHREERG